MITGESLTAIGTASHASGCASSRHQDTRLAGLRAPSPGRYNDRRREPTRERLGSCVQSAQAVVFQPLELVEKLAAIGAPKYPVKGLSKAERDALCPLCGPRPG
jgi:hypothetical protein